MERRNFFSAAILFSLIASSGLALEGQPAQPPATAPADERLGTLDMRAQRVLAAQVALDRAGFSPGELDAAAGTNTRRALRAYQENTRLTVTGEIDEPTVSSFGDVFQYPVATYAISAEDVAGPFVEKIPADMMEKSKLPALAYTSVLELLSERFHASPKLLQRLNPEAKFERGEIILVPNVDLFVAPGAKAAAATQASQPGQPGQQGRASTDATRATGGAAPPKGATDATRAGGVKPASSPATNVVTVTDKTKTLTVENAAGETIFHAPVTVGSENDPLPVGEWKVNGVSQNPPFNYNPDLFWDADPSHAKAKIPAGPNNPVGVVWIDLSKEHYGIHGTPEPSRIGYTESHGCIRLSNWNAMRLAALVAPGTKVILR
jgi:lipoprotein-anchoring transpeptidase ErfK/SrfK